MAVSDLVKRVARAIADTTDFDGDRLASRFAESELRDIAQAAIAAMQTAAAPALKPAVEVWEAAYGAFVFHNKGSDYEAAAAVIEADRAAIIAAKDAEIAALQAHADALAVELQQIEVDAMEHYNDWMEHGCEKAEATRFVFDLGEYTRQALRAYEEFRRD